LNDGAFRAALVKIEQFPSWDDFVEQFNPIKNHMDAPI
jgi:hypothetical protein